MDGCASRAAKVTVAKMSSGTLGDVHLRLVGVVLCWSIETYFILSVYLILN